MEKYCDFDKDVSMIIIDFKQAYDTNREQLWIVLQNFVLSTKMINLIKTAIPILYAKYIF